MSRLPDKIRCSWCGELKPIDQIHGYDPVTGDTSQAYCMRLNDCNSDQAREMRDEILGYLWPDEKSATMPYVDDAVAVVWKKWSAGNLPTKAGYYELKYRDNTREIIHVRPWFLDMGNYEPSDLQVDYLDGSDLMELREVMPHLTEWRGPIPEAEALNPL